MESTFLWLLGVDLGVIGDYVWVGVMEAGCVLVRGKVSSRLERSFNCSEIRLAVVVAVYRSYIPCVID